MSVRIERLIGHATLQGPPICGYRQFGVPAGGAFDQEGYALACALVGEHRGSLLIELANAAVTLRFSSDTRIAVCGPTMRHGNRAFDVTSGELELESPREGVRVYVSAVGGWTPDGIDSPLARSGRLLRVGDVLECAELVHPTRPLRLAGTLGSIVEGAIRVVAGPQPLVRFDGTFTVSNDSDRTGIRLDGLGPIFFQELTSEPACPGAIQLTPSGQLIVIGPDGPTIGGYPKVAVVCSADLDRLAQLRPGQVVRFERVSLEQARALKSEYERRVARTVAEIRASLAITGEV